MRSMTGYAKVYDETDDFKVSIEIKSVNNKNLNMRIKAPSFLNFLENQIKTTISSKLSRGYLDVKVDFEDKRENEDLYSYNANNAKSYMKILDQMENDFGMEFSNKLETVLKFSNAVRKSDVESDEKAYAEYILANVNATVEKLNIMKTAEGTRLKSYFIERVRVIEKNLEIIKENRERVVKEHKERLLERLIGIRDDITFKEEDILKEILIFTDRSDISEEVSRLDSHLVHFNEEVEKGNTDCGKKLDFILQEMFRELNTMGVKCNLFDISKLVVASKSEVEKIREQVMNIE
jgi:uncharacterized protein (TIGR00255 family)